MEFSYRGNHVLEIMSVRSIPHTFMCLAILQNWSAIAFPRVCFSRTDFHSSNSRLPLLCTGCVWLLELVFVESTELNPLSRGLPPFFYPLIPPHRPADCLLGAGLARMCWSQHPKTTKPRPTKQHLDPGTARQPAHLRRPIRQSTSHLTGMMTVNQYVFYTY